MTPIMWKMANIDIRSKDVPRDFNALLYSPHHVLDHVRLLHVIGAGSLGNPGYNNNFVRLLVALRQHHLESFSCTKNISGPNLLQLLSGQRKLRILAIEPQFSVYSPSEILGITTEDLWFTQHPAIITPCLAEVEELRLSFQHCHWSQVCPSIHFYIKSTTKLRRLFLDATEFRLRPQRNVFKEIFTLEEQDLSTGMQKRKLETLYLKGFSHGNTAEPLINAVDFSRLKILEILDHVRPEKLLYALARQLIKVSPPQLTTLSIGFSGAEISSLPSLENLLDVVTGLKSISINSCMSSHINPACIARHGSTLESLTLASHEINIHVPYATILAILTKCPKLKQLALVLPDPHLGSVSDCDLTWELNTDTSAHPVESELHGILIAITTASALHTLRILSLEHLQDMTVNARGASEPTPVQRKFAKFMIGNYANKVLSYLFTRGSKIKVLAVSPLANRQSYSSESEDENGHIFPHYYYMKGKVWDMLGREDVVARPVGLASLELPESTILGTPASGLC
jgi:hypothetical protein